MTNLKEQKVFIEKLKERVTDEEKGILSDILYNLENPLEAYSEVEAEYQLEKFLPTEEITDSLIQTAASWLRNESETFTDGEPDENETINFLNQREFDRFMVENEAAEWDGIKPAVDLANQTGMKALCVRFSYFEDYSADGKGRNCEKMCEILLPARFDQCKEKELRHDILKQMKHVWISEVVDNGYFHLSDINVGVGERLDPVTQQKYRLRIYGDIRTGFVDFYTDDFYEILKICVDKKNLFPHNPQPSIWILDQGEYVRVHDYNYKELTYDNAVAYMRERILYSDRLLENVRVMFPVAGTLKK